MLKRMLSLLLSLLLVVSMLPMGVLAEELANEEPTQAASEEAPDNSEPVEASDPSEPTESPDPSEPAAAPAPSEPADPSEPSEAPAPSEATEEPVITVTSADGLTELSIGDRLQLTVTVLPEYPDPVAPFWSSSDEAVAAVDQTGLVTGISAGTVTITVQCGELQAAMDLTVTSPLDPDPTTEPEDATVIISGSGVYVNPMYAGTVDISPDDLSPAAALAEEEPYTDVNDIVVPLRTYMCARADSASLPLEIPAAEYDKDALEASLTSAIEQAMAHTGVPTQGDYLRANFRGAAYGYSGSSGAATVQLQLSFQFEYNDNADQEEQMDAAVSALLAQLSPSGTDYQKIRTVYDYITANITYDYTNLNDDTYLLKYSPYAALVNKTAVCQGYAGLLYRLALEMGVSCRMITGTANGGGHAWNIIGLDGSYYNVDATWDAGLTDDTWFLLTDSNFSDHTRDSNYASASFYSAYPMGTENYTPAQESDAAVIASGSCGGSLTYTLTEDGVLTIAGTGAMTNYSYNSTAPWYANRAMISRVVLSSGLTSIGNYAFYECTKLASVTLPGGVTAIGSSAFQKCSALKSVFIPTGVTSIGASAFDGCSQLTSVSIPQGVTAIASSTFSGCAALTSVSIPAGVTSIGSSAFSGCSSLVSISLPGSTTAIGRSAFYNCSSLESLSIPQGVTSIEGYTFYGCTSLRQVSIPDGVTSIGDWTFCNCSALESISIPDSVNTIEAHAFSGCASLKEVTIPKGVTTIPVGLFSGCAALESVSIPDGVVSIESSAFYGCAALTSVNIPQDVVSIGSHAFYNCSSLQSLSIPQGVAAIQDSTFYGCSSLVSVSIPDSVAAIGEYAFYNCSSLESITIPQGVASIENNTFYGCSSLVSVSIPDSVASIGSYAFRNCSSLVSVSIPEGVTSIGNSAFGNCSSLQSVSIPQGVAAIEESTFYGCSSLTSVSIPEGVTSIGYSAFDSCSSLVSVSIPEGVTSIERDAFECCSSLESVSIPSSVTSIGSWAFNSCPKLSAVTYAGTMQEWAALSCQYPAICSDGTVLRFGSCGDTLGYLLTDSGSLILTGSGAMTNYAYSYSAPWYNQCASVTSIVLPEGLTSIGTYAFYNFSSLDSISIPAGVASISSQAFSKCTALKEITFGHTVSDSLTIGENAFLLEGTTALNTRVRVPYTREIHPAVSGYDWAGSMRTVTYLSTENLPATALTINTHLAEIEAGLELALTASVEPSNATSEILWSIDEARSTGTASIDENGILVGLTPGLVTVLATSADDSAVFDETTVTILAPTAEAEAIVVTGDWEFANEVEAGATLQMIPRFIPGNTADKSVTWSVDNGTGSATIDQNGLLTALTPGTVTVWATAANEEAEGSCTLNIVRYAGDITIFLDGKAGVTSLGVGQRMILSAQVSPEDATCQEVVWSVEDGTGSAKLETYSYYPPQITGLTAGTVTLRATSKDNRAISVSVELTVSDVIGTYALPDGSGNLYYNRETGVITGCDSTVRNVSIPASIDGVSITSIAPYAFCPRNHYGSGDGLKKLVSVSIPASVTAIGDHAFTNCSALTTVRINTGGNLTTIGDYAFDNCQKLATLRLNTNGKLTSIGTYAFSECEALTTLTIPDGVTTIGERAFFYCVGITDLTIPDSVTSVGQEAFEWLSSLKNLTIPGELDTRDWLWCASSVESVTFTGTRVVSIPHTVNSGGGINYSDMPGRNVKRVVISEGITTIEPYAFFGCSNITEVVLPEGLLTMGERAFSNCNSLEQMDIPQSLQSVGRNCFEWCEKLQLIDISAVPDKLVEQEYSLDGKANIPTWLVRASGGKTNIDWECWNSEGEIGLYWSPDGIFLWANGTGRCQLVCVDRYSGARGSKWVEASAGLAIRPADVSVLSAGEQLQLSAWMMPDEQKVTATWSLGEGDSAYAILSSSGLLTAKNVTGAHQVTVTASAQGETATAKLWILPRTTALLLYTVDSDTRVLVGQSGTAVQTLDTDMFTSPTLALQAVSQPEDASAEFIWSSSAAAVAQVDENGNVTLRKPGTATITAAASDGSGVKVSVKLNVFYLDEAKTLTAVAEAPEIGLQPSETAQMQVFGTDKTVPLDSSLLSYSIPDNQQHIAVVESNGRITALTPGTVTVTARIPGDPLNRSASVTLKVIPTQSAFLQLVPGDTTAEIRMLDEAGNVTEDEAQCALYCVLLDVASEDRTFTVSPRAADQEGRPITLGKSDVKWVTTDSKLAALTVQSDGSARVTIPAGASGACAIRGVTNDLARNSASVWVFVRDYAPQLETASLTMNSYLTQGVSTGLTESYGNTIEALELYEYDAAAKAYADTPSERLTARYENARLTLTSASNLPNGTMKLLLKAQCANNETCSLPLTLKVANKLPSVTVKQSQKFNLFYRDSEAQLLVSVKGQTITGITLADTEDFALSYDPDTGVSTLRFSDSYLADHAAKADTKATLRIFLAGWNSPVTKAVTIGTVTTKPSLTTAPSASIVNTALAGAPTASIRVHSKTTGHDLNLSTALIGLEAPFADADVDDETLILTLKEAVGGTAKLTILDSGWMQPITLTHKVTVQTTLPKVSLSTSTLKLNRYFTMQPASASMTSSQSNLPIDQVEFQSKAAPGTAARLEADKLALAYADGRVTASIPDAANAPKAGSYVFTYTALLADKTALPSGTIKVTVDASLPKVKLASTSLKLNRFLSGREVASTAAAVYKNPEYELINLIPGETWPQDLGFAFEEGTLRVTLLSGTAALQRRSLSVNAVLRHIPTGQEITLPTALALSVQVYESQALSVSLSTKGKLDTQKPGSALTYTVSRMNNCTGIVEDVTLAGADADKFTVRLVPDAAKPTAELTMKPGIPYSTKTAYKVQLLFRICGQDVASSVLTVKVSQSALKFTKPSGSTLYRQSQTVPLTHTVTATSGLIGEIRLNENRTSPDFLSALADDGFECVCSADGTQAVLTFRITRPANLIRNKSYTVYLDVIPVNCAVDKAPTTLKLTVKVLS